MSKGKMRRPIIFVSLIALIVAGCAASGEPKRIAAFPSQGTAPDTERYIPPPYPGSIVYNADIELEVSSPEETAERARALAVEFGGYLVSSTSWTQEGEGYVRMVLAVPVLNFDGLRDALVGLGKVRRESVWGEKAPYGSGREHNFSTITLLLIPGQGLWPSLQIRGWDPVLTFQRAFEVFISIFGFVVDILIWLVVVAGPFLLIAWLAWALVRKGRARRSERSEAEPTE